jgi:hypothetical protein
MRYRLSLLSCLLGAAGLLGACSGLVAGPEVAASTPVPASRDSAYTRARRGLTAESFTMDVVDSVHGHLTGTRYPSSGAKLGTPGVCRVVLAMNVSGSADAAEVTTATRWVAPDEMADSAPEICDEERQGVLERINQTLVPQPAP